MPPIKPEFFEEHYRITTEFKLRAAIRQEPFDDDFVHQISGRILASFDEGESTEPAGTVSATLVQFDEALEHQIDPVRLGDGNLK